MGGGGYISIDPKGSLQAESALLPIDHEAGITNHFKNAMGSDPPPLRDFKQSPPRGGAKLKLGLNPALGGAPERSSSGLGLDHSLIGGGGTAKSRGGGGVGGNYNYRAILDTSSGMSEGKPRDTMDFFNKINKVAKGPTEGTEREGRGDITVNSSNMAARLDLDNFPSLPDYEGI